MRVCTLANRHAVRDLRVLFETLKIFQKELPDMYVFVDSESAAEVQRLGYPPEKLHLRVALEPYHGLNRRQMESMPGAAHPTLFGDFTAEKAALLEWVGSDGAAAAAATGVFFLDADICLLGPLPAPPAGCKLALSPHMIRSHDTDRFGIYNAGFLWVQDPTTFAGAWRDACKTSRFFEQGCLEDLFAAFPETERHEFGKEHNYGWWRLFQSDASPEQQLAEWGLSRTAPAGITVAGRPLGSVHTHWYEQSDRATATFNKLVLERLEKVKHIPAVKRLLGVLRK
jgi:hypothetical protein